MPFLAPLPPAYSASPAHGPFPVDCRPRTVAPRTIPHLPLKECLPAVL